MFLQAGRRGRTNLDEFTLELGHSVLQSPIGVLREEVDDVLELLRERIAQIQTLSRDRNPGPTYAHLPVIERIDMLKRINCGHLDRNVHGSVRKIDHAGALTRASGSW